MSRGRVVVGLVLALGIAGAGAAGSAVRAFGNLTGTWTSPLPRERGGTTLKLTQSVNTITWVGGPNDRAWIQTFTGTLGGSRITGSFQQDAPGVTPPRYRGSITIEVLDSCHFKTLSVTQPGQPDAGGATFTKTPCTTPAQPTKIEPVPIETVSNGCGGAGWKSLMRVQNWLGNTSTYHNSNDTYNIAIRGFTVDFVEACNLHDAGYAGAVVRDKLRGGVKDFRGWTRLQVDKKFLADMRLLCERAIPRSKNIALTNCRSTGGNFSVGAQSRYNFVRCWGDRFFDADPSRPGTQRTGPRGNDQLPATSKECRFVKADK